jgi:nitroimidazol reductase NimA-like FMN-containing flavoprotein (pyridoxamine 5'-phosphate oxidase superfamily)
MLTPKNPQEVQRFMNTQRLASFATVDRKNAPHVVPIFFTYDDGKLYIQTDRESVKARNLLENNSVSVAVYSGEEAVIIKGKASVINSSQEFKRRTREHIMKYKLQLDELGRDSLGIPLFNDKIRRVVEVTPKRMMYW